MNKLETLVSVLTKWPEPEEFFVNKFEIPEGYKWKQVVFHDKATWIVNAGDGIHINEKTWRRARDSYLDSLPDVPFTPPWNGEGVPPVGTVCEFHTLTEGVWRKVVILAVTEERFIIKDIGRNEERCFTKLQNANRFRSISTECDKAIEEMMAICHNHKTIDSAIEALHAAGYVISKGYKKHDD